MGLPYPMEGRVTAPVLEMALYGILVGRQSLNLVTSVRRQVLVNALPRKCGRVLLAKWC